MPAIRRPLIQRSRGWRLGAAIAVAGLALPLAAKDSPAGESWINIDGPPAWVAGAPVDQKFKRDWRGVRLEPGRWVAVRLPARADLRLVNPAGVLITGDLEIAISNGSGLYMGLPTPEPDSVGHVVVTRANKERVVRIARSHDRTGPLRVAAFVSTYDTVSTLRRRVSPINDAPVIVRWYQQPSDVEYWPIGPRQSGELVVEGPTNILLDTIVALSEELQETHSGYRIYAHFGDDAPDLIEFAIGLSSRRAFIDGLERVLGRRRATRIAVPAGRHRLVLHADAEVYARVSVFTPDNYLLPVNIPSHVAPEAALAPGSHWDLTENDIENWAHGTIEQRERVALRLARDNQRRGGGLLAANLLEQTALAFPHNTRLANLATAFAQRYTMHRQLLPRSRDAPITHRFHWLASPERFARIAELVGRNPKNRRLALASLENAHFFDFDPDAELVFAIPPRGGDSTLRLAAAVTANRTPQMFQVQFDDGSPAIPVYLPADAALRSDVPTDTEPHDRLDDDAVAELTLLPPFASHNRPARLVKAASVEIPLPVKARTVTLKATSGRLHVTAQYRVSRRFALTETEHDAALRRTGPYGSFEQLKRLFDQAARPTGYVVQVGAFADADNGEALLNQLVTLNYPAQQKIKDDRDGRLVLISLGPYPTRDAARAALQTLNAEPSVAVGPLTDAQVTKLTRFADNDLDGDLASHRAPLVRWLRSRHTSFRNRTAATHGRTVDDARRGIDTERMAEEARRLEHNGAWQLALERWRQINGSASRQLREVAVRGQYQALMRLNEPRLAEAYLRDVFQHDDDPVIRDLAFAMLSEHYTNEDNRSSQEMFLAAAALRDPGVAEMHRLIDNLLESGRAKDALTLALAMPPWDRPLGAIVEASYEVGWWDTFGAAVAKLDDEEQRHWWRGYRTQARGEFDAARELWNRAGTRGRQTRQTLDEGLRIRAGLAAGGTTDSAPTWAHWQDSVPGKHLWANASHLLYASAGGAVLYWPNLDGYRQTFRSTPEQPLRLRVHGPQQLEIHARVVLDATATEPIDDWLEVGDGATVTRFSLDRSRPQPEVDIVGAPNRKPSRTFRFVYDVGPGDHDITLAAAAAPLLMQVYTRVPRLPLAVLPALTAETLDAMRVQSAGQAVVTNSARAPSDTAIASSVFADSVLTRVALYQPELVAHGRPILDVPAADDGDMIRRVTELVQRAEQTPAEFEAAMAETERLSTLYPAHPSLAALKSRLDRRADWELLRSVQTSAGSRLVTVHGWTPESPKLALRKALSDPVADDELVVTGGRELGVNIAGELIERLELRLALGAVDFARIDPMTAYYSLDNGPRQHVELHTDARRRTFTLPIPTGEHHLKVGLETPLSNQYLRVRLRDPDRNQPLVPGRTQRTYHVATVKEPVRFALKGPAWLRIHQRHLDSEAHEFRYVDAGWQTVTLASAPGSAQSLYRVYRRVRRDRPGYVPPVRTAEFEPLPSFAATIPTADLTPRSISESELLRHQRGGWSLYGAAIDRRNVDEDQLGDSERFAEFGAVHRHRLMERSTYFRTTLLGRLREFGGPTFGIRERIDYRPDRWPINLRFDADLWAQQPGDELDGIEWSTRIQARADGTLILNDRTRHRPSVRIFARYLSLDEDAVSEPRRVDQDVFSRYKGDHRYGLSFADTLTYQPWADTRWYGGPALTTNEDFDPLNPDYLQARVGWTQLISDWVVDSRYQYRRYFADSDRSTTVNRHQFRLGVDWDPLQSYRRWHLDFSWIHDFSSTENSLRFAVRRDIGASNASRDYYPGEVQFLGARRQRTAAVFVE